MVGDRCRMLWPSVAERGQCRINLATPLASGGDDELQSCQVLGAGWRWPDCGFVRAAQPSRTSAHSTLASRKLGAVAEEDADDVEEGGDAGRDGPFLWGVFGSWRRLVHGGVTNNVC